MTPSSLSKDQWIANLVSGGLRTYLESIKLVKKGDNFSFAELLGITREDLVSYFDRNGYPQWGIPDKKIPSSPDGEEWETVLTLNEDGYTAYFIERGIPTPIFRSKNKEEFGTWWKNRIIDGNLRLCTDRWAI